MHQHAGRLRNEPEVVEGRELCDLTQIFDSSTQLVIAPLHSEPSRQWSPGSVWGTGVRQGVFTVRTRDGIANEKDLHDACQIAPELGRLLSDLSEIYATLVGAEEVGVRWMWTNRPQCPRFHEDRTVLRGVYNHCGPGTEWLPSQYVDRRYLGHRSEGLEDEVSGLLLDPKQIRQIPPGTLSVFKGLLWDDNPGAPIVHRSPPKTSSYRFAVTLDGLE